MSDADEDLDSIREAKRERLLGGDEPATGAESTVSQSEPVYVDSPDHFQELTADNDVVLVDFYADWCGPCKMLEPTMEDLARETDATVAKVDIDSLQQLAMQYNVRGVPTVYLFVDGQPAQQWVGVRDKGTYQQAIAGA